MSLLLLACTPLHHSVIPEWGFCCVTYTDTDTEPGFPTEKKCVVCLTVCVPSPYSSIPSRRQSYVILIEFEWNGLKVSEVDNLENRKFLEASHLNL